MLSSSTWDYLLNSNQIMLKYYYMLLKITRKVLFYSNILYSSIVYHIHGYCYCILFLILLTVYTITIDCYTVLLLHCPNILGNMDIDWSNRIK